MAIFKEVAINDMRKPGWTGTYRDSYQNNDDVLYGVPNFGWNVRANLQIGRYQHNPGSGILAFTNVNPDLYQIGWVTSSYPSYPSGTLPRIAAWGHMLLSDTFRTAHAPGYQQNTRVMVWEQSIYMRRISTGTWSLLKRNNVLDGLGYGLDYRTQNRAWLDMRVETNAAYSGYRSFRITASGAGSAWPYYAQHWWYGDYESSGNGAPYVDTSDIADLLFYCKTALILENPVGADDRDASRYLLSQGADPFPEIGVSYPVYPGLGIGRAKYVRAKWPDWQFHVMHTMTEEQVNTIGLPADLTNLVEGGGSVTPPPDPEPPVTVSPTIAGWSALTTPRNWASTTVSTTPPIKVKRGRRARQG